MKQIKTVVGLVCALMCGGPALGASVVASVNGTPITDTDITARTKLMARQGQTSTDNRRVALQNIIDDNVKLAYAANFNAVPDDETVEKELKKMNLGDMTASEKEMAKNALRAEIAWQIIVARTVLPTVSTSDEDIAAEKAGLAREHGLPIQMTIVRLTDIPADVAAKLTKPKTCDEAVKMAEDLGGVPQKFTAMQYELSPDIRERVATLPQMTWSKREDNSVLLVCSTKKTDEYKNLDDIIKQNTQYKQAMFMADQQLKQLRRRAVIVINDDRYKL
ncbi:MAG: hypothetical protein J6L47_03005 [Alphaproteobacteria bacterium]|nr:hypothetical protein [Alphaproteobacteria bacterium]